MHGGRREVVLDTLVNPGRPIPPAICAITNITNAMVRDAPTFTQLADQVVAALAGRVFVAHNARFDWNFVSEEVRRARDLALDGPRLCTVRLARRLVKGVRSCGLDNLTQHFGFENAARHRAAGDALVTADLLARLLRLAREEGAATLQDLAAIALRRARRGRRKRLAIPTEPRADCACEAPHVPRARLSGRPAPLSHAGRRPPAARRWGHVRRGAAAALADAVAPDERHRIPLAMRCLLIEHPDGLVLIDTALGNKEDARFLDIYGVENAGLEGATQLEDALASAGFLPGDVRWVINTHLHFDHAGGNTTQDPDLEDDPRRHVRPTFPNATYVVQRGELEFARRANERTRASYLPPNFEPIAAAGRWQLLDGDAEVLPGISVRLTPATCPITRRCWSEAPGTRRPSSPTSSPRWPICRCPGSWATTWSRCERWRASARFSVTRWTAAGGWCSSMIPWWLGRAGGRGEGRSCSAEVTRCAPDPAGALRLLPS